MEKDTLTKAKKTKEKEVASLEAQVARLELEKSELEQKIENSRPDLTSEEARYMRDLSYIDKTGRVDSNKIVVKEINDHTNISLWDPLGKRVGPLHPVNVRHTYEKFYKLWSAGKRFRLSPTRPSAEDIEKFKKSDEYKAWKTRHDLDRARKSRTRKKGELERILTSIAQMTGKTVGEINDIRKPGEVVSPGAVNG